MGATNWITSFPTFLWRTIYLIFIFPLTVVIALFHFLAQLIAWTPFIFLCLILWGGGTITSRYINVGIQELDYLFRCILNPVVTNIIGPLLNLLRYPCSLPPQRSSAPLTVFSLLLRPQDHLQPHHLRVGCAQLVCVRLLQCGACTRCCGLRGLCCLGGHWLRGYPAV